MIQDAFWGILIPFLGTSLGAGCVFFLKNSLRDGIQRALTGFAAGVMVAASVWSLLIPAMEQAADLGRLAFFPAAVGFWLGILFLLLLDHLIPHLHQNSLQAEGPKSQLQRTTMMVLAVTLHNIPEGMAVGLAFALAAEGEGMAGAAALALGIGLGIGLYDGLVGPGTGTFAIIAFSLAAFYEYAPARQRSQWKRVLTAAFLVTSIWIALTAAYGFYILHVSSMGLTYGSLIGLIVLFIWFHLAAIVIISGGEFIAVWDETVKRKMEREE